MTATASAIPESNRASGALRWLLVATLLLLLVLGGRLALLAADEADDADDDYVTACRKQGMYPVMYMPHNHHFLWAAAS